MTHSEKATEMLIKISQITGYEKSGNNWWIAKAIARNQVDEIISALQITTGHCELRHLDLQEIQNDFRFWQQVRQDIDK